MTGGRDSGAAHRRVWTVRERAWLAMAALVPGVLLSAAVVDPSLPARIALALTAALLAGRVAAQARGGIAIDPSSLLAATLVALVLPTGSPWWSAPAAALIAVGIGRGVWASPSAAPIHPAMLGVALVMMTLPPSPAEPPPAGPWPGLAWMAGGVALAAFRVIRWPSALAMMGALLAGLATTAADAGDAALSALADGRLALVAFFVAGAPASGALTPWGRWITGTGIGLAAALANPERPEEAVPYAVLLMNGLAPLVDRWVEHARPPRVSGSP